MAKKKTELDQVKLLEKLGCKLLKSESKLESSYSVSTGIFPLDLILTSEGGLRSGSVEIFGPPGTGKTSMGLSLIKKWCEAKIGNVYFFNVERRIYKPLIDIFSLKVISKDDPEGDFYIINPQDAESCLAGMENIIKSEQKPLVVLDSLAACVSREQYDDSSYGRNYDRLPALMSSFMPKIRDFLYDSEGLLVLLNQVRANITRHGKGRETKEPGGNATKFLVDWRVQVRVTEKIKNSDGDIIGQRLKAETHKNSFAKPFQTATFHLIYGNGFDEALDLLDIGISYGIITNSASWFEIDGEKFQGQLKIADYIRTNKDVADSIKKQYTELVS